MKNSTRRRAYNLSMLIRAEDGYVLITIYFFMAALLALLAAYYSISDIEIATTKFSRDSVTGFYSAEAGLNIRAEEVRDIFVGYNLPTGVSPSATDPCVGANIGSGDYECQTYDFNRREVITYVTEEPSNPISLTIPPGERYQGLNAMEYRYTVSSVSYNIENDPEALLELRFKSRLVPLFQFVAFYDKDLEILPGPTMNLSGPIHTNGDLYMNANNSLNVDGQVTAAGALFRGRKNNSTCSSNPVTVIDPINFTAIVPSCSSRTEVTNDDLIAWNGMVEVEVPIVVVPEPDSLDADPGQVYWANADLRLGLDLDSSGNPVISADSPTGVYVYESDQSKNSSMTASLHTCSGNISSRAIGTTSTFFNNRESLTIRMLEIDMRSLFDCLDTTNWLGENTKDLDDSTDGGLVLYTTVFGDDSSASSNNYGVRLRNALELQSTDISAPRVLGLTVVSDQALYTHGNYNSTGKIPAALMCDSINILSNNWNLNDSTSTQSLGSRSATDTVVNAAILSGTDSTGGIEGVGGQGGSYNGGLENYPRFHESWSGRTLSYRGSFVSLNTPRHVDGAWVYGSPQYQAPARDWDYDTDFNDAANLPPLTPRFVYLKQELFVRDFEQD